MKNCTNWSLNRTSRQLLVCYKHRGATYCPSSEQRVYLNKELFESCSTLGMKTNKYAHTEVELIVDKNENI